MIFVYIKKKSQETVSGLFVIRRVAKSKKDFWVVGFGLVFFFYIKVSYFIVSFSVKAYVLQGYEDKLFL